MDVVHSSASVVHLAQNADMQWQIIMPISKAGSCTSSWFYWTALDKPNASFHAFMKLWRIFMNYTFVMASFYYFVSILLHS